MASCKTPCNEKDACKSIFLKDKTCNLAKLTRKEAGDDFKPTKGVKFADKIDPNANVINGKVEGDDHTIKVLPDTGLPACRKKCQGDNDCKSFFVEAKICHLLKCTKKEAGDDFKETPDAQFEEQKPKIQYDADQGEIIDKSLLFGPNPKAKEVEDCIAKCNRMGSCKSLFLKDGKCFFAKVTKEEAGDKFKKNPKSEFRSKRDSEMGEITDPEKIISKTPGVDMSGCKKKCAEAAACRSLFVKDGQCHLAKVTKKGAGDAFKPTPGSIFFEPTKWSSPVEPGVG